MPFDTLQQLRVISEIVGARTSCEACVCGPSRRADNDRKMTMELEKGITRNGEGFAGVRWNILGQSYFPKAVCDSAFAFETNSDPGQFVPVHIHPTQDEFILVQGGAVAEA